MNQKLGDQNQGIVGTSQGAHKVSDEALQLVISRLELFDSHAAPAFLASSWTTTAQVVVASTDTEDPV